MANKPAAKPAAAAPAAAKSTVTRKRRNTLERKCLGKEFKRQFVGSSHGVFKLVLAAWKEARKKVPMKAA